MQRIAGATQWRPAQPWTTAQLGLTQAYHRSQRFCEYVLVRNKFGVLMCHVHVRADALGLCKTRSPVKRSAVPGDPGTELLSALLAQGSHRHYGRQHTCYTAAGCNLQVSTGVASQAVNRSQTALAPWHRALQQLQCSCRCWELREVARKQSSEQPGSPMHEYVMLLLLLYPPAMRTKSNCLAFLTPPTQAGTAFKGACTAPVWAQSSCHSVLPISRDSTSACLLVAPMPVNTPQALPPQALPLLGSCSGDPLRADGDPDPQQYQGHGHTIAAAPHRSTFPGRYLVNGPPRKAATSQDRLPPGQCDCWEALAPRPVHLTAPSCKLGPPAHRDREQHVAAWPAHLQPLTVHLLSTSTDGPLCVHSGQRPSPPPPPWAWSLGLSASAWDWQPREPEAGS